MSNQERVEEFYYLCPNDLLSDEVDYELLIRRLPITGSFVERCEWLREAFLREARLPQPFHLFSSIQHELPLVKEKVKSLTLLLRLHPNRTGYLTRLRHCQLRLTRVGAFTLGSQQSKHELLTEIKSLLERFGAGNRAGNGTQERTNNDMNSNQFSFDPVLSSSMFQNEGNLLDLAMGGESRPNPNPNGQGAPPGSNPENPDGRSGSHTDSHRPGPLPDIRSHPDNSRGISAWDFPPFNRPPPGSTGANNFPDRQGSLGNSSGQGQPFGTSAQNNTNPSGNREEKRDDGSRDSWKGQIDHYIKEALSAQFSAMRAEITQASLRHLEQQIAQGGLNFNPQTRPPGNQSNNSNTGGMGPQYSGHGGDPSNTGGTVPESEGNQNDHQNFGGSGGPQLPPQGGPQPNLHGGQGPRPSTPRSGFPERRHLTVPANKWRIHFSGEPRGMTVNQFISRVETLAENNKITEQELLGQANFLFKENSEAEDWYFTFCHRFKTWAEFKTHFQLRFEPVHQDRTVERQIMDRRQYPNEPIMKFVDKMERLMQQLGRPIAEERKLEILKENIKDAYKPFLLPYRITTINELIAVCIELDRAMTPTPMPYHRSRHPQINCLEEEEEWDEDPEKEEVNAVGRGGTRFTNQRTRDQPRIKPSTSGHGPPMQYTGTIPKGEVAGSANAPTPLDTEGGQEIGAILCWNCRQFGHYWRNCEQDKRVFCHFCGHTNVTTGMCPNNHFLDQTKNDYEGRS